MKKISPRTRKKCKELKRVIIETQSQEGSIEKKYQENPEQEKKYGKKEISGKS